MPTIHELLIQDGWTPPENGGKNAALLFEASDEGRGLVSAKNDFQKWKEDNAEKVAGFDAVQAERDASLVQAKDLAIKNGNLEEYLAAEKAQIEIKDGIIKKRNEQALSSSLEAERARIASMFIVNENGLAHAQNFVSSSMDDDGNVSTSYKIGSEEFATVDDFKVGASNTPWLSSQMKGPESSGPTTAGNSTTSTKSYKSTATSSYAATLKR